MPSLTNISKDYLGFLEAELSPDEMSDCLDSIKESFEEKGGNIVAVVNEMKMTTSAIDEEIKRLQARKKAIVNTQERMKEYLRYNMENTGINKIDHPLFNITLAKAPLSAEVFDEESLPDDYVTIKTEIKPDKRKILSSLKSGESIEGAKLVEGKRSLRIS